MIVSAPARPGGSAHTGSDRSVLVDAGRVPLSRVLAGPYRHGSPLLERPSTG